MDKYEQITNFITENYKPLNNWIYFIALPMEDGNTSMIPVPTGMRYITEFIDGSKDVNLQFAIAMVKLFDVNTSTINLEAIKEVENFTDWFEQQDYTENYPILGDGYKVYEMQVLDATPTISIDNEQSLVKYQFNCSINYIEEREDKQ